jgi:hypothetical protein
VYGSYTALGTPSFQYEWITLNVANAATSDKMIDIGYNDGSGNWHRIADHIAFQGRKYADLHHNYSIPLRCKAGKELGARIIASTGGATLQMTLTGYSKGPMGLPGYSRMIGLNDSWSSSRGLAVDPGGTANTKGSWAVVSTSCIAESDALFCTIGYNGDTTRTSAAVMLLDLGVGASSSERVIVPNLFTRWSSNQDGPQNVFGILPVPIKSGIRIVARSQCSDNAAGDRTCDVCVYGFVS